MFESVPAVALHLAEVRFEHLTVLNLRKPKVGNEYITRVWADKS